MAESPVPNLRLDAAHAILAMAHRTGAAIEAALAPSGIGPRDYDLLVLLASINRPVRTTLAELLAIGRSTMMGVIDRIERADGRAPARPDGPADPARPPHAARRFAAAPAQPQPPSARPPRRSPGSARNSFARWHKPPRMVHDPESPDGAGEPQASALHRRRDHHNRGTSRRCELRRASSPRSTARTTCSGSARSRRRAADGPRAAVGLPCWRIVGPRNWCRAAGRLDAQRCRSRAGSQPSGYAGSS